MHQINSWVDHFIGSEGDAIGSLKGQVQINTKKPVLGSEESTLGATPRDRSCLALSSDILRSKNCYVVEKLFNFFYKISPKTQKGGLWKIMKKIYLGIFMPIICQHKVVFIDKNAKKLF